MWLLRLVSLLALGLPGAMALAQSDQRSKSTASLPSKSTEKSDLDTKSIDENVAYWLKTCLADWDKETHMTREEWRTTCKRVSAERGKFLRENPTVNTFGTAKVQKR
jgi:hypothetical protein